MKDNGLSTTRLVLGVIGMVVFGVLLIVSLVFLLVLAQVFSTFLILSIVFAAVFLLSALLMNSGLKRKNLIKRLSRYMAELSTQNDVLSIDDMTRITGFLPARIIADMRLLKRWDLSFDLYTDKAEQTLLKGKSVYNDYLETVKQRDALAREERERLDRLADPETATLEAFREEGLATVERMRAANLLLPGEEISNSLQALEKTTKRIFEYVQAHPEKLPETRKLISYHLPTTMKLIEKYCQYDSMEYQSQSIEGAKAEIEKALAAANEAFANFLESLYHVETLDVTTDAEVLTKMFEKDGLTGKKFDL